MTLDTKLGRELLAKATPAPWNTRGVHIRATPENTVTHNDGSVASILCAWDRELEDQYGTYKGRAIPGPANAALVVWLRNNAEELLAAAEHWLDDAAPCVHEVDLKAAKANYYALADAVCRESTSPEDACRQARETREQLAAAQARVTELVETVAAIVADLHRQADAQDHRSEVGKAKASALMAAASRLASGEWRK